MFTHKPTGLRFKTKPWKHQLDAVKYLLRQGFGALYTKPGSGKTKVIVDLVYNAGYKRVLVVAPKKPCQVWPSEFYKHSLSDNLLCVNATSLSGTRKADKLKKMANCPENVAIFVVNYESVWREPLKKQILRTKWDAVVCDESHRIKTPSSKCSKMLALLHNRVPHRFLLTGTPLFTKPTDIYGQYKFLDQRVFGTNFGAFRDRYENLDTGATSKLGYRVLNRKTPYKNLEELHDKMFSIAFVAEVELHLPPVIHQLWEYQVGAEVEKLYKELKKEGVIEFDGHELVMENVLAIVLAQQQMLSGYVPFQENGVKINRKLSAERVTALRELIETLGDEPIVIFAQFKQDFYTIEDMLEKEGLTYSEISGRKDEYQRWKDGQTQVVIIQAQAGAEGIDLTRARYCIYYSKHRSLGLYNQSLARTHRPNQTRNVVYYHIIAKMKSGMSIDEVIISSHQKNMELINYIMEKPPQ